MPSRYDGKKIFKNDEEMYRDLFRKRGVNHIRHFETMKLIYPTIEQLQELQIVSIIWSLEDKWWKLAAKHYGDASLWYVIAFFNRKPTDYHVKVGDIVQVPFPLDKTMRYMGL